MPQNEPFTVEVAYATPETQSILQVSVEANSTAEVAIDRSGILELYPEIDLCTQKIGIFSKIVELGYTVQPGDRIEIYRPLTLDPKEARKRRASR